MFFLKMKIGGTPFREFTFHSNRGQEYPRAFSEADPNSRRKEVRDRPVRENRILELDLDGAQHAEISVQYWGGHIGTSEQRLRVNDGEWIPLPQPVNTPQRPELYHRTLMGDHCIALPLNLLRDGENRFQFTCGPQIKYGFDWGFYWIYSFTVRVYYDASLPHPTARVMGAGGPLEDYPLVRARVEEGSAPVSHVEFIGKYRDYDREGDGIWEKWHYQFLDATLTDHIGSTSDPPWRVVWNTQWLPDQDDPLVVCARVRDQTGMFSWSDSIHGIELRRTDRSVRLYPSVDVPEGFGVRTGRRMACTIPVSDTPGRARAAMLVLSTWCGAHANEICLNGEHLMDRIGLVHDVSCDYIPVPMEYLRQGANEFSIFSNTEHHAAEVNWPGPALLVEYRL